MRWEFISLLIPFKHIKAKYIVGIFGGGGGCTVEMLKTKSYLNVNIKELIYVYCKIYICVFFKDYCSALP